MTIPIVIFRVSYGGSCVMVARSALLKGVVVVEDLVLIY